MTTNNIDYKVRLRQQCITILKDRIATIETAMVTAQSAANNEEKSSAGDKYETSRAMSHREKDMQGRQLLANQNELAAIVSVEIFKTLGWVTAGNLVCCNTLKFFIVAGLGKINFEGELIYLVSPLAPLAKTMMGKYIGDIIIFNTTPHVITSIF